MAKISLSQIRDSLPAEKNRADSIWTRYILRPVSIPVAWIFMRFGISANAVSYLSALLCVVAGILYASGDAVLAVTGAFLFNFFAVLDCADGNIARTAATTGSYGGWADALGGYVAYVTVLLSLGYAAAVHNSAFLGWIPQGNVWVLLGGIAASANLLMRLVYQSYKNIIPESSSEVKKSIGFEKILSENLGVTGLLMPAVFIGLYLDILGHIVVFYAVFYTLGCVISLIKMIRKVEHASRKK